MREEPLETDVVVGLPRGGVVVAAQVARVLQRPLDVLVVRKIGHPFHREFAVGAMAEQDVVLLDQSVIGNSPAVRQGLEEVIRDEAGRLGDYERRFHCGAAHELAGRRILIIDDGLATGATMEAAVASARKQGSQVIIVAVPVASTNAMERIRRVADDVIVLVVDPDFDAVGSYYDVFTQTSDEEVVALLHGNEDSL